MDSIGIKSGRFVIPEIVSTHFMLRPGDKVADFGAGKGNFSRTLSHLVGSDGQVYACEIQKNLVEAIGDLRRVENLSNVEPVWCDLEAKNGTKLEDQILDAGVLVNTLLQIQDKTAAIEEIYRVLRPGGKLFLIDWSESFSGMGPQPADVVSETSAKDLFEQQGFVFERSFDAGDHHYGLAFRKP